MEVADNVMSLNWDNIIRRKRTMSEAIHIYLMGSLMNLTNQFESK